MLDANLQTQLKAYLVNIRHPIELVASTDDGAKSRELLTLLEEVAALSGQVSVSRDGDDPRRPSFLIRRTGTDIGVRFAGIPGRTYRLEYSNGLTPASWQVLSGATVTADAVGVFEHTDTSGAPTRYYRSVYP